MNADAPPLTPVPLAWLVTHWRPGSRGDDWTWAEEYAELVERPETAAIERRVLAEGIGFMDHVAPILLGTDGRVWDGHHRIVLAMKYGIGWVMVEGAVDLAPAPAPSVVPDLTSEEAASLVRGLQPRPGEPKAAIEASAERIRIWLLGLGALTLSEVNSLAPKIARDALTAALPTMSAAIRDVLALHTPVQYGTSPLLVCQHCRTGQGNRATYPCLTIRAVTAHIDTTPKEKP